MGDVTHEDLRAFRAELLDLWQARRSDVTDIVIQSRDAITREVASVGREVSGVNARLDKVNGRLDKHDEKLIVHETAFLRMSITTPSSPESVFRAELKWYVLAAAGIVGATIAVLRMMGKIQ